MCILLGLTAYGAGLQLTSWACSDSFSKYPKAHKHLKFTKGVATLWKHCIYEESHRIVGAIVYSCRYLAAEWL